MIVKCWKHAGVAELAYARDSKSRPVRVVGSSPTTGKMNEVNFDGKQANCFACLRDLKAAVMFFQQKKQTRRGSGKF